MATTRDHEDVPYVKKVLIVISLVILAGALVYIIRGSLTIVLLIFAGIILGIFLNRFKCIMVRRLRLPPGIALSLLLLLMVASLGLLVAFMLPVAAEQTANLLEKVPDAVEDLRYSFLKYTWGEALFERTDNPEDLLFGIQREDLLKTIEGLVGIFSGIAGGLMAGVFVFVIGTYIAADMPIYYAGLLRLLPPAYRRKGADVLNRMGEVIYWWLLGQGISMAVLGCVVFAGLHLLGIPFALLFALFTALMTFIPNLGPMLAFIPIGLMTLSEEPAKLTYVVVFYVLVQSIEGFALTPLIHRKIITLPPVLVISVQIILLNLVGLAGILMAMPLVACGLVAVQSIYTEEILDDKREFKAKMRACR
jgi:predicted PurR-regulated permease PerM